MQRIKWKKKTIILIVPRLSSIPLLKYKTFSIGINNVALFYQNGSFINNFIFFIHSCYFIQNLYKMIEFNVNEHPNLFWTFFGRVIWVNWKIFSVVRSNFLTFILSAKERESNSFPDEEKTVFSFMNK